MSPKSKRWVTAFINLIFPELEVCANFAPSQDMDPIGSALAPKTVDPHSFATIRT